MEATTTPDFVQAAVRDFEALANRDSAGMEAAYADDAVVELVPIGILRGSAEVKDFFDGLFAALPDLETTYEVVAASERGRRVAHARQLHRRALPGCGPNRQAAGFRGVDLMRIEDDRIARNTAYYDGMDFARQLGMMPGRDSGAEKAMIKAFNASTKLRARFANR